MINDDYREIVCVVQFIDPMERYLRITLYDRKPYHGFLRVSDISHGHVPLRDAERGKNEHSY